MRISVEIETSSSSELPPSICAASPLPKKSDYASSSFEPNDFSSPVPSKLLPRSNVSSSSYRPL
eukprot:CAMPEP_0170465354 /NCGR_PEP_ID=MMETSP0123-20130129/9728_1 /TAXON_ID=182087 /ORGANISM="Favella ehrenbergii, Strain Fehren 1" /LENGTH=63 /DNA_ID=CAMNT_0010731227 /DNA_START=1751 /DNA_END=1939 /DNA_ORIENTATION=-